MKEICNMTSQKIDIDKIIPKDYPSDLNECLMVLTKIKYKSYGAAFAFLDFDYYNKTWGFCYRNPANFINPNIKEQTPLKACHKMFDFLRSELQKKNENL